MLTDERIDEIHPMVKDFSHWKRAFARAIEAEVRAEAQEPCQNCEELKELHEGAAFNAKYFKHEYEKLQAKVAEQSAEIERLTNERDEYNSAWQRSGVEYRKLRDSLLSLAGEFK